MLKRGHEAIRGYKYKITSERTSEQDPTLCSSFAIDACPSSFKNYTSVSLQTSAQILYFSQALLTEFAAWLLQQALWGQRGAYMAMASATP